MNLSQIYSSQNLSALPPNMGRLDHVWTTSERISYTWVIVGSFAECVTFYRMLWCCRRFLPVCFPIDSNPCNRNYEVLLVYSDLHCKQTVSQLSRVLRISKLRGERSRRWSSGAFADCGHWVAFMTGSAASSDPKTSSLLTVYYWFYWCMSLYSTIAGDSFLQQPSSTPLCAAPPSQ